MAFHRLQGVDRFFLYNNESTDGWYSELRPEIESGVVEIIDWPGPAGQWSSYNDCITRHRKDTRWLAVIDIDEFLFSPTGRSLPQVLQDFETYPGVVVNLRFFGTNGHKDPPRGLVTETYVMRARDDHPPNALVKSIVYPRYTYGVFQSANYFRLRGNPVDENHQPALRMTREPATTDLLRINHYYAKSEAEFAHKLVRPRPDTAEVTERMGIPPDEVRDETILRFLPQLKQKLAARNSARRPGD